MEFRNAIFVVTEETRCPIYNVGEEFKVEAGQLSVPEAKPTCLLLAREIAEITAERRSMRRFSPRGEQRAKFECGGCAGLIRFEFKKEREFATLQMKLLAAAERREKTRHLDRFAALLRRLAVFEPLNDENLRDLSGLLALGRYEANEIILRRGAPGTHLYIVLSGRTAVVGQDGEVVTTMEAGEIFGEMSLLSGEPVTSTVLALEPSELASLSSKDFKHVLNRFPVLQVFFYRLLVERVSRINRERAITLQSGFSGDLAEISVVELFQLLNSGQRTGKLLLEVDEGAGEAVFNEGELVAARLGALEGKEAFFALLGKHRGRFSYVSGLSPKERELEILGGFMGLVMEGMRRIDEAMADPEEFIE